MNLKIPKFMKAVQGFGFGDIDEMLSVEDNVPVPRLNQEEDEASQEVISYNKKHPLINFFENVESKNDIIIKTLAVSLSPVDVRVLSGKTKEFQGPTKFPYVPGSDASGIVVEIPPDEKYFKVGDYVTSRFTMKPRNCLGEYARVSRTCCDKYDPSKITAEDAAVLASASPASIIGQYIKTGERVLILGANGGIGSHVCQLAKAKKGTYVCGVSNDPKRLLDEPLCCDDAIDYTTQDIFDFKKYREQPFDTIIDLACGGWPRLEQSIIQSATGKNHKNKSCWCCCIVKPANQGGRFVTITPDYPTFEIRSFFQILSIFMFKPIWRTIASRIFTRSTLPKFTQVNGLPDTREVITNTINLALQGELKKAVMDPNCPLPMTTDGVRKAFRLQESRHAKGKVVITVST